MAADPARGMFPETSVAPFILAPDVEDLALRVLRRWPEFKELRQAIDDGAIDVAFVFETKPFDPEKEEFKPHTIAKVTKASPLWACMSGHDLVIQFRQAFWDVFDEARREAVLHHEWMHVAWDGKLSLRPHDVEEMVQSARRYGPSLPGRRELAAAFADWARENAGDASVPLRVQPAEDLPDVEVVAHAFGNAVADAIARGESVDGETEATVTRDVSRFAGLVLPEESLDQAYARLERRGDFTEVMESDAGQLLLKELAQQQDIRRRSTAAAKPSLGDAVVDDGTKYRIREVTEIGQTAIASLAAAGPSWKRTPIVANADLHQLEWDKVASVWRGPTWGVDQ